MDSYKNLPLASLEIMLPQGKKRYSFYVTKILEKVISEVRQLPETDQDAIAQLILEELEAERKARDVNADDWTDDAIESGALDGMAKRALEGRKKCETYKV